MITKTVVFTLFFVPIWSTIVDAYLSHLSLDELAPLWTTWKNIHNKQYSASVEETSRFNIFAQNYHKIIHFNSLQSQNNKNKATLKLALNKFADMTEEEFKAIHSGGYLSTLKSSSLLRSSSPDSFVDYSVLNLPESVDWRDKGAVTPVKNQQHCGSCWAFSTIGALESLYFLTHGKLMSFSEQQIVDCDRNDGGCNGGLPQNAFEYTAQAGVESEEDYPYTGVSNRRCNYESSKAMKVNTGYRAIKAKSVSAMKAALNVQPVSVGIEADQRVFQFYHSGVIKGAECGDDLDHAVLVVGYTKVDGEEAFIVKNSWSEEWGTEGYVYISTDESVNGGNGVCGILGDPVVPIAE